jgi:hypothetical protein
MVVSTFSTLVTYEMLKKNFPFPYGEAKPVASSLAEPQDMSRVRARNALKVSRSRSHLIIALTQRISRSCSTLHLDSVSRRRRATCRRCQRSCAQHRCKVGSFRKRGLSHKRYCTPVTCCISQKPCIQHVKGFACCPAHIAPAFLRSDQVLFDHIGRGFDLPFGR